MLRQLDTLVGHVSDTIRYRLLASLVSALCFGVLEFTVHQLLARTDISPLADSLVDAISIGLLVGVAVWVALLVKSERRQRLRKDLERIGELNHEIRNALQVIRYSHFDADGQHQAMVIESVERIDAALKRLVPLT